MAKSVSKSKKKAWKEFADYIKKRDTNYLGTQCFSCKRYGTGRGIQAGHFQPGRYKVFLFDERQVHAQCYRCNINLKGNWPEYYKAMVKEYGKEEVEEMINRKHDVQQWKVYELEEIYKKYKAKVESW